MARKDWKEHVEVVGIAAVVVSLVVLIIEVRENTAAIDRQISMDRASALAEPFFESELPSILAKIASVESVTPTLSSYMELWDLSESEAILWERHLTLLWETLEAQFVADGPSEQLDNLVSILLGNRDNQIYVDDVAGFRFSGSFRVYVSERQANLDAWKKSHLDLDKCALLATAAGRYDQILEP